VLSAYFYALNAEVYLEEKFQDGKCPRWKSLSTPVQEVP
jgi:hypothetical protein